MSRGRHFQRRATSRHWRAGTSASRYRRCPPSAVMDGGFAAFAQPVTVLGSTASSAATSAGVSSGSTSDRSRFAMVR